MSHTTHLGIVALPGPTNSFPLSIDLHADPRQTTASTTAEAATLGRPEHAAITVVGEIHGHVVDLGVRAQVDLAGLPTTIEELAATEPVAGLIAEFEHRLKNLTLHLTVHGLALDDRIAAAFTVDDLESLHHYLTNLARRWRQVIDDANAAAEQPQHDTPPKPGFINIEPTPSGYQAVARLAATELTRVMDIGQHLDRLLDLTRQATGDEGNDNGDDNGAPL